MDMIGDARAQAVFPDPFMKGGFMAQGARSPPVRAPWRNQIPADVLVERGYVVVRADLPGMPGENIEVIVTSKYVEIIGWPPEPAHSGGYFISERRHEVVRRTLRLPEEVVAGRSVARLAGGVLEVRIPRMPLSSGWVVDRREA